MKQSSGNTIFRKEILIGIVMILSVISGYSYFHVHSHVGMILYNFIILSGVLVLGYRCARVQVCSLKSMLPSSADLLGMMQIQRHDFLNHLQVLGGLTQLKKTERVMEYISATVREINQERVLTKLLPPEAGLVLLSWCQRLREYGISFNIELGVDMSQLVDGLVLAALLSEMFSTLFSRESRPAEILLKSSVSGSVVLELMLRGQSDLSVTELANARELARKAGGIILVDRSDDMIRVRVQFSQPTVSWAQQIANITGYKTPRAL